jgi:hypothetical protein
MWGILAAWSLRIVSVIPTLVSAVEQVFKGTPKSGPQKWVAVSSVLAPAIADVATDLSKLAPPGTPPSTITAAIARYTKAINDATVAVANDLGIFTPSPPPAP